VATRLLLASPVDRSPNVLGTAVDTSGAEVHAPKIMIGNVVVSISHLFLASAVRNSCEEFAKARKVAVTMQDGSSSGARLLLSQYTASN
jgi:hypothetical protein